MNETADLAVKLRVTPHQDPVVTCGNLWTASLTAYDEYDNVGTFENGEVEIAVTASATTASPVQLVDGIGAVSVEDTVDETTHVSITSVTLAVLSGEHNVDFVAAPSAVVVMDDLIYAEVKSIDSSNLIVGDIVGVNFTAYDVYGNIARFEDSIIKLHASGSAIVADAGIVAFEAGHARTTLTDDVDETVHIHMEDVAGLGADVSQTQEVVYYRDANYILEDPTDGYAGENIVVFVRVLNRAGELVEVEEDVTLVASGSAVPARQTVNVQAGVGVAQIRDTVSEVVVLSLEDENDPPTRASVVSVQNVRVSAVEAESFFIDDPGTQQAGSDMTIEIQAHDKFGNVDTTFDGSITAATTGAATGAGRVTIANGRGILALSDQRAEAINISLVREVGDSPLDNSHSRMIDIVPGPLAVIAIVKPREREVGVNATVTITALDGFANVVTEESRAVTLMSEGAGGTFAQSVRFDAGVGRTDVSSTIAETIALTLRDSPEAGADISSSQSLTFRPGAPQSFAAVNPGDGTCDDIFHIVVEARDEYGNIAVTEERDVSVILREAATGTAAEQRIDVVAGVASFSYTSQLPTVVHLSLQDSELTHLDTSSEESFAVESGAPVSWELLDTNDASVTVDTPVQVTVEAHDQYGNRATAEHRDVTLVYVSASRTLEGVRVVDVVSGVGRTNIHVERAEVLSLSVVDSAGTGHEASSQLDLTAHAGVTTAYVILDPTDGHSGTNINVTVQALDQYGNVVLVEERDVTLLASGNATGSGIVDIVSGAGMRQISDDAEETVHLSLRDSEDVRVDVTSTQDLVFVHPPDVDASGNSHVIEVSISAADFASIKALDGLATSGNSTYMTIDSGMIADMAGNDIEVVSPSNALRADHFDADLVPPVVTSFDLDMDSGVVVVYFSETVNTTTTNANALVLQSHRYGDGDTESFRLRASAAAAQPAQSMATRVLLSEEDMNEIKLNPHLAAASTSSFLSLAGVFVKDVAQNDVRPVALDAAVPVASFQPDVTAPQLLSHGLNMRMGYFEMVFSETMSASSINPTRFSLRSSEDGSGAYFVLTGGVVSPSDGTALNITFTNGDFNAIKGVAGLATSQITSYLAMEHVYSRGRVSSSAADDMNANHAEEVLSNSAMGAAWFVGDDKRGSLVQFAIDMDEGEISLSFDETMNVTALDPSEMTLQDRASNPSVIYTPGREQTIVNIDVSVLIALRADDLNNLKLLPLCTSQLNCFLSYSASLVSDMAGFSVFGRDSDNAIHAAHFVDDSTPPTLVDFTVFDFGRGTLDVLFSEALDVSSMNFTQMMLQTLYDNPVSVLALSAGTRVLNATSDGTRFVIELTEDDVNRIKADDDVCRQRGSCWMRVTADYAQDMAGNALVPTPTTFDGGRLAHYFRHDTISPELTAFRLDMDAGELVLTFSETIAITSVRPEELTIMSSVNASAHSFASLALSSGIITTEEDGPVVEIRMLQDDVLALKADGAIATSEATTALHAGRDTATDASVALNRLVATTIRATTFVRDSSPPVLLGFTLNMDDDSLTLTFDEPVLSASTLDVRGLTLFSGPASDDAVSYTLTSGETARGTTDGQTEVRILLDAADIRQIKLTSDLARASNSSFIGMANGTIYDMAVNPNAATVETLTGPARFVPDSRHALVIAFDCDMDNGQLRLTFNDVVDASSFSPQGLILQADTMSTLQIALASSTTASENGYTLVVDISREDQDALKARHGLATSTRTTYLSTTAELARDAYGKDAQAITNGNAIRVTSFTPDSTSPRLDAFDVDVGAGTITLSFNEVVNVSSLDVTTIRILNGTDASDAFVVWHELRGAASVIAGVTDAVVTVELLDDDLNAIKGKESLAVDEESAVIHVDGSTVLDMNGNALEPSVVGATGFVGDGVAPTVVSFALDLDLGELTLEFSETVLASTLEVTSVRIQDAATSARNGEPVFTLTGGSAAQVDLLTVSVDLLWSDLNAIKERSMATSVNDTYLVLAASAIEDANGNGVLAIVDGAAVQAYLFRADETNPELSRFDLDVDAGILVVHFTETVKAASVNPTSITFFSLDGGDDEYELTGGALVEGEDSYRLAIALTATDLNELKLLRDVATSSRDTMMRVIAGTARDMNGNAVVPSDEA